MGDRWIDKVEGGGTERCGGDASSSGDKLGEMEVVERRNQHPTQDRR